MFILLTAIQSTKFLKSFVSIKGKNMYFLLGMGRNLFRTLFVQDSKDWVGRYKQIGIVM
jgi:hypothetical protein